MQSADEPPIDQVPARRHQDGGQHGERDVFVERSHEDDHRQQERGHDQAGDRRSPAAEDVDKRRGARRAGDARARNAGEAAVENSLATVGSTSAAWPSYGCIARARVFR